MMRLMIFKHLVDDIDSMMARDPAARSRIEVVLAYPGFQALLFYRLAHALWRRRWRLLGRVISHLGRFFTGIEIHPGATIGRRLFIDHGIGLVVGETADRTPLTEPSPISVWIEPLARPCGRDPSHAYGVGLSWNVLPATAENTGA